MAQLLRIANAEFRPRRLGDFVRTETAQDIWQTLDLLRHRPEPGVAMIAGAPGTGKTKTLSAFLAELGHDALRLEVACGEGKPSGVGYSLLRAFGMQGNGMSLPAMRETLVRYIGRGRLLVLDDAHNLQPQGADWVRCLAEDGGFDLVLCGGLDLPHLVNKIASLRGRVHSARPVIVKRVSLGDVESLVDGTAFATEPAIKALHAVAQVYDGGFRNVEAAMLQATLFAGDATPMTEHLA
jgi:DNA transposition AAA+ family ATPase